METIMPVPLEIGPFRFCICLHKADKTATRVSAMMSAANGHRIIARSRGCLTSVNALVNAEVDMGISF